VASRSAGRVVVENVNHPGRTREVEAERYGAVRQALLAILPEAPPGMPLEQVRSELPGRLPEDLFPGGAKAGWWLKTVQLDLEAKGLLARSRSTPLRLHRPRRDERRPGDDPGDAAPP